ncbi:MAG TPA: hypothetical protein VK864_21095, partial [Longimicrobiales bacterium]|nr:hypothetical protein [Longimicrobiales bacterium]
TWTRTSTTMSIPWFFGQIRVDPSNAERVYFLGQTLMVSDDGGKNFRTIGRQTHADHHAMWIDPYDSDHLIDGNDGGLYESEDRGQSWDFAVNLPVSTFYAIGVDMREPCYYVYGGLQDNGSWGAPVCTRDRDGVGNEEWVRSGGGDGFYAAIDPTDPNVVYSESQNGALTRFDFATRESKSIRPQVEGERLRYNWSAPLLISPHDHNTLYFGANFLFRSPNRGDAWQKVSPDLTRALDRDQLPIMGLTGAGGLGRHDGTAEYGNLSTIDESKLRRGLLYTGSDDGVIAVSRDGGTNWTRVEKFPGVPEQTYVSRVIASQHNEGTAYATFDGHRSNDFKPYVFKTTDYGKTWTAITSNLPDGSVYVIREHHRAPSLLVVGAEYGVFVTLNGGKSWTQMKNGIAPAPVHDLIIHPRQNDLVVGTHGRGIFVLDDITALEELAGAAPTVAKVVRARPVAIHNLGAGFDLPGDRSFAQPNPTPGAPITYFLGTALPSTGRLTLRVKDAQGNVVRELPAPTNAGVHRVQWDLRYAPPITPARESGPQPPADEEGAFRAPPISGPPVFPGTYTVQLLGGEDAPLAQGTVEVRRDPLVRLTDAEYRDLHNERMRAYDLQVRAQRLAAQLDEARRRLTDALKGKESAPGASQAQALVAELDTVLVSLRGPQRGGRQGGPGGGGGFAGGAAAGLVNRVNGVASQIGTVHFAPTAGQKQSLTDAGSELDRVNTRAQTALAKLPDTLKAISAQ